MKILNLNTSLKGLVRLVPFVHFPWKSHLSLGNAMKKKKKKIKPEGPQLYRIQNAFPKQYCKKSLPPSLHVRKTSGLGRHKPAALEKQGSCFSSYRLVEIKVSNPVQENDLHISSSFNQTFSPSINW